MVVARNTTLFTENLLPFVCALVVDAVERFVEDRFDD
jgi:hypothetical protein